MTLDKLSNKELTDLLLMYFPDSQITIIPAPPQKKKKKKVVDENQQLLF